MKNKKFVEEVEEKEEKKPNEVKLKSEMYHHESEKIERREEEGPNDAVMWGAVIGFALFFVLLIVIIIFVN